MQLSKKRVVRIRPADGLDLHVDTCWDDHGTVLWQVNRKNITFLLVVGHSSPGVSTCSRSPFESSGEPRLALPSCSLVWILFGVSDNKRLIPKLCWVRVSSVAFSGRLFV